MDRLALPHRDWSPSVSPWRFEPTRSGSLDDLVRTQAPRADTNPPHAAADDRLHLLKVRLEATRAHVVGVAMLPADDGTLPTDFTILCHSHSPNPQIDPQILRSPNPQIQKSPNPQI